MPSRQIPKNYRNVTGVLGGNKNQGDAHFESTLEQDFLLLLEHDPNVVSYEVQPVTIDFIDSKGIVRRYTPDVLVNYSNHNQILFEVKYREELHPPAVILIEKMRAAIDYARSNSWKYRIITDFQIRTDYLNNIRFLRRYKLQPINDPMAHEVERALYELREATPEHLTKALAFDRQNQAKVLFVIWQMLAQNYIQADLSLPITMATPLWLNETVANEYE